MLGMNNTAPANDNTRKPSTEIDAHLLIWQAINQTGGVRVYDADDAVSGRRDAWRRNYRPDLG
jgi:hypothetical protein